MDVVNIHEQSEMHKDAVFKEIADDHGTRGSFRHNADKLQCLLRTKYTTNRNAVQLQKFKCATRTGRCTGDN